VSDAGGVSFKVFVLVERKQGGGPDIVGVFTSPDKAQEWAARQLPPNRSAPQWRRRPGMPPSFLLFGVPYELHEHQLDVGRRHDDYGD
jgi:hypothetical protein